MVERCRSSLAHLELDATPSVDPVQNLLDRADALPLTPSLSHAVTHIRGGRGTRLGAAVCIAVRFTLGFVAPSFARFSGCVLVVVAFFVAAAAATTSY